MNKTLFDLNGKVAVLTGAARGLEQVAAVGLATYGCECRSNVRCGN